MVGLPFVLTELWGHQTVTAWRGNPRRCLELQNSLWPATETPCFKAGHPDLSPGLPHRLGVCLQGPSLSTLPHSVRRKLRSREPLGLAGGPWPAPRGPAWPCLLPALIVASFCAYGGEEAWGAAAAMQTCPGHLSPPRTGPSFLSLAFRGLYHLTRLRLSILCPSSQLWTMVRADVRRNQSHPPPPTPPAARTPVAPSCHCQVYHQKKGPPFYWKQVISS